MRHEFKYGNHDVLVTDENEETGAGIFYRQGVSWPVAGSIFSGRALRAEILRLAEESVALKARVQFLEEGRLSLESPICGACGESLRRKDSHPEIIEPCGACMYEEPLAHAATERRRCLGIVENFLRQTEDLHQKALLAEVRAAILGEKEG